MVFNASHLILFILPFLRLFTLLFPNALQRNSRDYSRAAALYFFKHLYVPFQNGKHIAIHDLNSLLVQKLRKNYLMVVLTRAQN